MDLRGVAGGGQTNEKATQEAEETNLAQKAKACSSTFVHFDALPAGGHARVV